MALQADFAKERSSLINRILSSDLHGKRIYILGSAEFGPTNEPILCRSTVGVTTNFGKQGTLIDAFHKIKYVSKDNYVFLVKTTGEEATAYLNVATGQENIHNGFILSAIESNEIYNEIKIIVDIDSISIVYPLELGGNTLKYSLLTYPTLEKLADKINEDVKIKRGRIRAFYSAPGETQSLNAFFPCNTPEVYFYGGMCGLNYTKNMLYNYLERTYEALVGEEIDIVIPIDAFMDDVYPNDPFSDELHYGKKYYQRSKDYLTMFANGQKLSYMNQLINFCLTQLKFGIVTNGIIGYNSLYGQYGDFYNESNDMALMLKACFTYNLSCCDNPFYSFLVSVVGGDVYYNQGTYIDNAYLAYAALCAETVLNIGTTNIPLPVTIYHELEEDYLKDLSEQGIVMFRHSVLYNSSVVYNGVTASQENEDLKIFCNVRMIQLAISYINKMFQLYVGMPIDFILNKVIDADLNKILTALVDRGILSNYEFNITPNYNNYEIKVYLNLETNYMIRSITICPVINIQFQENEV